jgi:hypothetical protein
MVCGVSVRQQNASHTQSVSSDTKRITYISKPVLWSVQPDSTFEGRDVSIALQGYHLVDLSSFPEATQCATFSLSGACTPVTFLEATKLSTSYTASAAGNGTVRLRVTGWSGDSIFSNSLNIRVYSKPTITTLNPSSTVAGGQSFVLRVIGTGFLPSAQVQWNGVYLITKFVSDTQLDVTVPASAVASSGTANVAVYQTTGNSSATTAPATFTVNSPGIQITTVNTNPAGRSFTVGAQTYTAEAWFNWAVGSSHTIATTSPQSGGAGTQYVFTGWSDGGLMSHTVTVPSSATTYTAGFTTQYQLTVTAGAGGTVSPPTGQWYNAGQTVTLTATPNAGYVFSGWGGDLSGTAVSQSLAMNAPHSVTATFTPSGSGTPTVVGTQPASGALTAQSFTYQFAHSAGYQNLSVLNIVINNFLDGRRACYLAYVLASNTLVLVDDGGNAGGPYAGSVALGSTAAIQNSQCAVTLTSAVGSGNTFALTLGMTFKAAFGGNRIQYLAARDGAGGNSDWQAMGVWQVPPTPTGVITVGGVSQPRGAAPGGTAQTLTFVLTDSKGAGDFGVVNVLVNNFIDGRHACYLAYVAASNTLYLVNDAGDAGGPFAGSLVLNGSPGTIQNSQCGISGTGSSASLGNTLMLTLNITFKAAFAGNRIVWAAGRDAAGGNNTDWQAVGTWTVQ